MQTPTEIINGAKEHWGRGWKNLGDDQKLAYIQRQLLSVVIAQRIPTDSVDDPGYQVLAEVQALIAATYNTAIVEIYTLGVTIDSLAE